MKQVSIKKWVLALLFLVLGGSCLLVCYQTVYRPMSADCEALEKSIFSLESDIKIAEQEHNTAETEKLKAKTRELLDSLNFPDEILEEDQILYIRDVEQDTNQKQAVISFGNDSVLYTSDFLELREKTFPFAYTTDYEGLKSLINYFVEDSEEPVSLVSLTVSYDASTDTCTGTLLLRRYYLTGIEVYTPPAIPGVEIGTENIFG